MYFTYYTYPNAQPVTLYPIYFPPYLNQPFRVNGQANYPKVDPSFFHDSSTAFKQLLQDASHILDALSDSEELASEVMTAAQENKTEQVEKLIKSTGVQGDVEVDYNPDGINLTMISQVEGTDCCKLTMAIRWR